MVWGRAALARGGISAVLAGSVLLSIGVSTAGAVTRSSAGVQSSSTGPALVAWWAMNEGAGSVMNDAVADNDGRLHSARLAQSGYSGTAYGFNGSSSYVSVPSDSDLNPGTKDIVITIHLKTTSVPAKPDWDLIRKGKYTSKGGEFKMEYQPTGKASCGFKGSSQGGNKGSLSAGPALNNGKWHRVQCVKTSSAIRLIVDGKSYSKPIRIGSISNSDPVVIGARPGSEFFQGVLDEAIIQIG